MKLFTFTIISLFSTSFIFGQTVQLEGLYATSTKLPHEQNSVVNLFDDDPFTNWSTMKGAGPDEGIMLHFSEPTYISRIEVKKFSGANISTLTHYKVYGDGKHYWRDEINEHLKSLYIKIETVVGSKDSETVLISDGYKQYHRDIFDERLSIGISELVFYGKDDIVLDVKAPKFVKGNIQASSSLNPNLAYGPGNLMDSRKEFGWAEGISGNGIGEEIRFTSEKEITISAIKIWNGYQRSPSHFEGNARLKKFQFGKNRQLPGTYSIADSETPQLIELENPLTGKEFVFTVDEAFSGTKYKDLVISEMKFFNGKKPIIIQTSIEEARINHTKSGANLLLQKFLDRNISVWLSEGSLEGPDDEESYRKSTSFILRSNNTFVMYDREALYVEDYESGDESSDVKETIADGNWELKESNGNYLKIRIFGKIFSSTTAKELYRADVTSSNVRIFQDNLTLTKDKITGERFVDEIILRENEN